MENPLVYVLVINWNGKQHLEDCFDSLIHQTYPNARYCLVDNASDDGSVEFIENRYAGEPRVSIIRCGENLGWSRGNNVGIERALSDNAEYIYLLNNDTASDHESIERLVSFAKAHPEAGAIAPKMVLFDQPWLINSVGIACSPIASAWDIGLGRWDGPRWRTPQQVLGVCGGAMFLRAAAIRDAGLLPDDFEIYLDDLDLCLRIWDAGYECWSCPDAVVGHKFSATMGEGARGRRKYYLNTRNRLKLMLRNFPANKLPSCLLQYAFNETRAVGRAVLQGECWKIGAHAKSVADAIASTSRVKAIRSQKRKKPGAFWPHLAHGQTFFPGIELPSQGWYSPRVFQGRTIRPISMRAWIAVPQGRLRVTHMNCYPELGATSIDVLNNGRHLATLSADTSDSAEFTVEEGEVWFESRRMYEAESTQDSIDSGGWLDYEMLE